jgi:hypothetical protein
MAAVDAEFRRWAEKRDRELRDWSVEREREFTRLQHEIADQRVQIQANMQALLRVLDRLGPA